VLLALPQEGFDALYGCGEGLPDFRAPPAIPKFIDTSQDTYELSSRDSFEPSPDDF